MLSSRESGVVSVLLVGLLGIGSGVVWVTLASNTSSYWQPFLVESKQLTSERQRLIYYAVDYANLYGHGGAGPGHFPCPDTDVSNKHPGPNPPCGSNRVASGKLPDGVGRRGVRIAFSHSLIARSWYSVVKELVNNPALPIGDDRWPSNTKLTDSLTGYVQLKQPSGQSRVIAHKQLHKPVYRWVRAWLVNQWLTNPLSHCERVPTFESALSLTDALDSVIAIEVSNHYIVLARCQPNAQAMTILGRSMSSDTNDPSNPSQAVSKHCSLPSELCTLVADDYLFALLGNNVNEWQGVPLKRHWFIRNGWLGQAELQVHSNCIQPNATCVLLTEKNTTALQFLWIPERMTVAYADA